MTDENPLFVPSQLKVVYEYLKANPNKSWDDVQQIFCPDLSAYEGKVLVYVRVYMYYGKPYTQYMLLEKSVYDKLVDKNPEIYFGEIAGKYSDIVRDFNEVTHIYTEDPEEIWLMKDHIGNTDYFDSAIEDLKQSEEDE